MLSKARNLMCVADNLLAAGCQLTLILCFVGGGYIRLFEVFSEYLPLALVRSIMVFSSPTMIAMPLVIITMFMLVLMLGIMVNLIQKEGRQPFIRLTATNTVPEMTVEKGQKWHLFLSHVW